MGILHQFRRSPRRVHQTLHPTTIARGRRDHHLVFKGCMRLAPIASTILGKAFADDYGPPLDSRRAVEYMKAVEKMGDVLPGWQIDHEAYGREIIVRFATPRRFAAKTRARFTGQYPNA